MTAGPWIAVDWGTSRLRGWSMRGAEAVEARDGDEGMGTLTPDAFAPALARLTEGWDGPVIACGMVGARQGWVEAPYASLPCAPLSAPIQVPGHDVHIVPGLSQSAPPDVMRGEETQIAGFLALNPGWDGVICLPGTHSKWAELSAGEVISFRSFMTGEVFALLSGQSVLRHSMGDWDDATFDAAVDDALSSPARLASDLFAIRAGDLLHGQAHGQARLSGLLMGAELAAARPWWLGRQVAIIGAPELSARYARALGTQGVPAGLARADAMTLAGLTAARRLVG
ncbi:MAG: 2-dehydro-3-deoxygalactonokinase [Paracoccaceae bacterium]